MTAVPEQVLAALDRLNVHARAHGCGSRAIYRYKTLAAIALGLAGELEVLPFEIGVKCNKCNGTGVFEWWDTGRKERCRSCGAKGIAVLRFIETVHGERVWHHPVTDGSYPVLDAAWGIARQDYEYQEQTRQHVMIWTMTDGSRRVDPLRWGPPPASWGPNRPAEKLGADEVAGLLNVVEAWILAADMRLDRFAWRRDSCMRKMRRYRLHLDRTDEACFLCGTAEDLDTCRMGGSGHKLLDFSRAVCRACHGAMPPYRWPADPNPGCMTAPVVAWLERHQVLGFDEDRYG